jgi:O-antigen/teichoic acid export membrane protein
MARGAAAQGGADFLRIPITPMTLPSLAKGAALNLAGRVSTVLAGLLLMTLVARLGPSSQGIFALFVACEAVLLALFSGFGLWLARAHSQAPDASWAELHSTVVSAAMLVGVLAGLALWGLAAMRPQAPYDRLVLLAWAAPWLLIVPTVSGVWLGRGQLLPLNSFVLASPVVVLLGVTFCLLWWPPLDVSQVLVVWVTGKSAVGLLALWWSFRSQGWSRPRWGLMSPAWRFAALIGVTNVISLLNYRVNLFLVERLDGLAAAGIYSVAVTVAELLWLVSSAVTTAVYGRIGAADKAAAASSTLQAVRWGALGVLLASPLLLVVAWWAFPAVLGEAYRPAWWYLLLLLPGTLAYSSASGISAYFTNQRGQPWLAGGIALTSMLLNLGLSWWWIPLWGAAGAAVATSVSYGVAIVLGIILFLRLSGLPARALWSRRTLIDQPAQSAT